VIDILNALVDSSLVEAETRGDESRFGLLEDHPGVRPGTAA